MSNDDLAFTEETEMYTDHKVECKLPHDATVNDEDKLPSLSSECKTYTAKQFRAREDYILALTDLENAWVRYHKGKDTPKAKMLKKRMDGAQVKAKRMEDKLLATGVEVYEILSMNM